ncbi:LuxR C-terminal-related transcriptional regulator [Dactylosporangium siamense]|uniref:LuxR C-terminal-related transcriptional regulator n=1 Tax=Dactylosporangium siamense TaxID=685454 RepID=UPI00194527B7|nr:LuxR C-terminal-related transcriptional regulator [Dactylosporangium siamense]
MAHNDAAERFRSWNAPHRPVEAPLVAPRGDTPALPTVHLSRDRLMEHLDAAVSHPVTLLCAPTGWGKTALVASWIHAGRAPGRAAYVRFEVNCGATAWRQLTNALTAAGIAVDPATYAWTNARSNAHHHERAVVVLDDLHHVTNHTVLRRLERLITRLGDRISFLILARTEPPLSLYRWRVRGQLHELRTDHLALTQDEVSGLAEGYGVRLAQHFRFALWHVTEGWPAAVAVILSAMVGRHEPERMVTDIILGQAGLNEEVGLSEYVRREILQHLDPEIREVMLRTSILETVCPGLVEALTGSRGGARLLAQMSRANALASFYGGSHSWYRYRRLLRAMLRAELRSTLPFAEERALHRAAAGWYAANGLPSDALTHAIAGSDWVSAERLFVQYWPELAGSGPRAMTARDGTQPPPDIAERPMLALALALYCRDTGDLVGMSAFIRLGERGLGEAPTAVQAEVLAAMRLAEAVAAESPERAGAAAARLLERTEDAADEHVYADFTAAARAVAHLTFSGAAVADGRLEEADEALEHGADLARKSGFNLLTVQANRLQALTHLSRGRLSAAAACARRVLDSCRDAGIAESRNISYARLVLATVCRERGQLDEARFHIEESVNANAVPDPNGWVSGAIALALLLFDRGDHGGALEALEPLLDSRVGAMPRYADVTARALHAELCLHDGRLDRAHAVIAEALRHWPEADEPLLTLARLHLADGRPAAAAQVADRVLVNGPGSLVTVVTATVVLAQALRQLGDVAGASDQLDQALRMAGPEGIRRPFQGHATWIAEVLASPPVLAVTHPRELERDERSGLADDRAQPPATPPPATVPPEEPVPDGLVAWSAPGAAGAMADPLTEKESQVLLYLRSMLSIAEIAAVLSVSTNTVKTHVRHVYRKLGVSRRRDAVRRARELSLI